MNLRNKTLIVVGSFLVCLIVILYVAAQMELMISLEDIEERNSQTDIARALNAISNELNNLGDLADYWAARNDTYAFMAAEDPGFINYNTKSGSLTNDSLRNMEINLILFLDSYGQIVFSRYINATGSAEGMPQNLKEQLSLYGFCPGCLDKQSRFAGIILLSDQPMLIVTQPITNSIGDRPSMGRVALGRYLTQKEVRKLSDTTELNLTIYPLSDAQMPEDFRQVRSQLSQSSPVLVKSINRDSIAGYALLANIYGNPLLILRVDAPREIYGQGMKSVNNFIILFSLASLIFIVLTLLYLDRSVLSRLINLTAGITNLGKTPNASACLRVQGNDELSHLAISINDMLAALERAHQDLAKSEGRYKAVVQDQPDLICRYLTNGNITFANDAFCTFFSLDGEDIPGKRIDQYALQGQMKSVKELRRELTADHPSITYESKISMLKGLRWILWTSRGIFDDNGLVEIQSVGKEITDLMLAEQARRESEERYRLITENMTDVIHMHTPDPELQFLYISPSIKMAGYDPSDLIGKSPFDVLIFPEDAEEVKHALNRLIGNKSRELSEYRVRKRDGSWTWVETTASPILDQDGNVVYVVCSSRDILERKKAEEARRESEERYRLITENMTDVIHLHTPDSDIRYVYVTPSIRTAGYEPSEIIGKSPFDIFITDPDDADKIRKSIDRIRRDKIQDVCEYRIRMRDGSYEWVETTANPILNQEGNVVYVVCSSRIVPQRKWAEEALKESKQQMSDIISFLPDAILAIDLNGKVMIWNQAMEILTGVKAKDMLGKGEYEYSLPFYGYRRPILVDMVLKPYQGFESEYLGFQREEGAVGGEVFIPTFGQHGSYLLAKATALYDEIGNTVGAIESIRDMTDRRLMEQRLERSKTELHVAAEIQRSFIPKKTPDIPNFEIAAVTIPAQEVGGDFYDFIPLPDGNYGLVIADVAGKSIPAALFMALSRMIIRTSAAHQSMTSEVLKNANNMIALDATAGMFVTLLYGVLDGDALSLKYADAGHPTPLIFRSRECKYMEEAAAGIALGAKEDVAYEERTIKFDPGDLAVFYTDGVTEAMNSAEELYGLDRLTKVINKSCHSSAEEIMGNILRQISAFRENQEQNDDITLVVLKARGHLRKHIERAIAARDEELPIVIGLLSEVMSWAGFDSQEILEAQLATEEACSNIIHHGYREGKGEISMTVDIEADGMRLAIEDDAPRFDPTQFSEPDFAADVERRPLGGLGIHLIRSLVDEMSYEFQDGKNRLILIKRAKQVLFRPVLDQETARK